MQTLIAKKRKACGWVVFKIAKAATNQHMEIPIARGFRSLPCINN
ncbi:MAG: photosystem II protein Y [Puniceicoccaceae bacterium]|nr:photosystem II protein Y [Puniceicoccaceae bacterium]